MTGLSIYAPGEASNARFTNEVYGMLAVADEGARAQLNKNQPQPNSGSSSSWFPVLPFTYVDRSTNVNIGNSYNSHNVSYGREKKDDNNGAALLLGIIGFLGSLFFLGKNYSSYQLASRNLERIRADLPDFEKSSAAKIAQANPSLREPGSEKVVRDYSLVSKVVKKAEEMFGRIKDNEFFGLVTKVGIFAGSVFLLMGVAASSAELMILGGAVALISFGAIVFKVGLEWSSDPVTELARDIFVGLQNLKDHSTDERLKGWDGKKGLPKLVVVPSAA